MGGRKLKVFVVGKYVDEDTFIIGYIFESRSSAEQFVDENYNHLSVSYNIVPWEVIE